MSINSTNNVSKNENNTKIWMKFTILYSFFLFIILLLAIYLHRIITKNAAEDFWHQNHATLYSAATLFDNDFMLIENYCMQLAQNDSFLYTTENLNSMQNKDDVPLKAELSSSPSSYPGTPISSSFLLLRNTGDIVSMDSFCSEHLYYEKNYPLGIPDFNFWRDCIYTDTESSIRTMPFIIEVSIKEENDTFLYLIDLNTFTDKDIPVTAGFHISRQELKDIFSGISLENDSCLIVLDENHLPVFYFTKDTVSLPPIGNEDFAELPKAVSALSYENDTAALHLFGEMMHVTRQISSLNGWSYYLIQPQSLCASPYQDFYDILLIAAAILGLLFVFLLTNNSMRPIVRLDSELQKTITDRNQLQEVVNAAKPIIYSNYLQQLLSGSISNPEELEYIRTFLHFDNPDLRFYVMYGIIYESEFSQEPNTRTDGRRDIHARIREVLAEYFTYQNTLFLFSPKKRVYSLLLPFEGDEKQMLISIQERVLKFHKKLLEEDSVWFFTGIGLACSFSNIWESYQQAKDASGYTSKNYIFLPYEMIKKSSQVYYYPFEFSSRLIQFISTGSKTQVRELFGLIHKENIEERSLPFQMLRFLLSDIRNTLLKARFSVTNPVNGDVKILAEIDTLLSAEDLTFRSCQEIALKLCSLYHTKSGKSTLIDTIVEYIKTNYNNPSLGLNKISDEFNISESYFSHMFKENMNVNFSVYLEDLRLNEAARLIQEGNANLTEISEEVGYNNLASFRRAFKKKFGITPSAMFVN